MNLATTTASFGAGALSQAATEGNFTPTTGPVLVLDIMEATQVLHCGRTTVYELLKTGELTGLKIGKRRLITYASVAAYVNRQAAA